MDKSQTIRTFFAIELPDNIKQQIVPIVEKLKTIEQLGNIRWIIPKKWHLTLRFFAKITVDQIDLLIPKVTEALKNTSPVTLNIDLLKPFPNVYNPHSIALIPEPKEQLLSLANTLNSNALALDLTPEKRTFLPHITLCRFKPSLITQPLKLDNIKVPPLSFTATQIVLLQSTLESRDDPYIPLHTIPLKTV